MSTSTGGVYDNIREYGTVVDRRRSRVRCNYCAKVVSGFTRFKQHLGGVRGDVVPCHLVPQELNMHMRNALLQMKNHRFSKEVVQLISSINASTTTTTTTTTTSDDDDDDVDDDDELIESNQLNIAKGKKRKHVSLHHNVVDTDMLSLRRNSSAAAAAAAGGTKNSSLNQLRRCVGRFFYENGIEFSAATSTSFLRMTNAILECAPNNFKIPSCEELRGRILLDELEVIRRHVMAVKRSWVTTGCSILLDGWTDHGKGRSLINFLVDSPGGPIFLRSADVSGFDKDVNAMSSLLDGVIEEVGVGNVIQVITYSTSACMDALGKRLTAKHRSMFWTVCASHCIGLMLEKIEALALTKKILDRAKIITRFIYSHAMVLRLMRKNCGVRDVVCPSKIKSAASFLTLANIVSESKNLKSIFESFAWNTSTWASTSAGKMVADLVGESSFWTEAGMVLKATIPLVRVLKLLNGEDGKPQVGYIYETMDQAKEAIKMEFGNKKGKYLPFWKIIDEIWDNHLHSPLHSAGYYFNPGFFYSSDFLSDAEVASGLLCCIVRMVEDRNIQDLISLQMDEYRMAKGGFGDQSAVEQRTQIPPAEWWSRYGGQCPELQRFAIRILSQTCSGGFKYQLRRSLSEQMHTHGRNNVEQRRLSDLTFVHHNLQLQHQHHHHSSISHRYNKDIIVRDMDAMNDWVVAPDQHTCPNSSDSDWVFSDCDVVVEKDSGNPRGVVPPGFSLKQEAF